MTGTVVARKDRLVYRALPSKLPKPTSKLEGLPDGYDTVTTYGDGGGKPVKVKNGPLTGWTVGGGERSQVYGKSFHPSVPDANTVPWGFMSIATSLGVYPSDPDQHTALQKYNESLPQNVTRPGGELVEMMITPLNETYEDPLDFNPDTRKLIITPYRPFFFVSDNYTTSQVKDTLSKNCTSYNTSDPILFNSTGNIQPGGVFQLYRGDTAAMVLQGYDNANEQRDNPNLAPNPPFPPNVGVGVWVCMNATIGRSIPLMRGVPPRPWKVPLIVVGTLLTLALLLLLCRCGERAEEQSRLDDIKLQDRKREREREREIEKQQVEREIERKKVGREMERQKMERKMERQKMERGLRRQKSNCGSELTLVDGSSGRYDGSCDQKDW